MAVGGGSAIERTNEKGSESGGLLAGWLLDAQAPPKQPNNWIHRQKYYVLQLSDPNPNTTITLTPVARPPLTFIFCCYKERIAING